MNRLILYLICAAAAGSTLACSSPDPKTAEAANSAAQVVKTEVVQLQPVRDDLAIPAKVEADPARVVHIFPPAGGRLIRVAVRPGDQVRKGQTLAVLESSDVAQARSDYQKALSEVERTGKAFDRAKMLFDHKVLSEREYQQAESDSAEARAELARATERMRILGAPLQGSGNQVSLLAPHGGSVLELTAAPGELSKSTDNANPICTIADISSVWIVGDVFEQDLASVHPGEPVEISISAYPGQRWNAQLAVVSDAIDSQTRTLKVRAVLPNPGRRLKPEMFGSIRLRRREARAIVIPAAAVLREGGDTSVMVQAKPGAYQRRLVAVARADPKNVVVASGLKPGEVIVVQGAALLREEGAQP